MPLMHPNRKPSDKASDLAASDSIRGRWRTGIRRHGAGCIALDLSAVEVWMEVRRVLVAKDFVLQD